MSSSVSGSHKWNKLRARCFILSWLFGWFVIISAELFVYLTMSDTISFVISVFRTDNGESISSACTFMPVVPLNVNSRFPLLLWSQINSSTKLGSSTGMIISAGLLLSLLSELSLVVRCRFRLPLLQDGIAGTWRVTSTDLAASTSGSQTSLFTYFFNDWRWWLNWSNCLQWHNIYVRFRSRRVRTYIVYYWGCFHSRCYG